MEGFYDIRELAALLNAEKSNLNSSSDDESDQDTGKAQGNTKFICYI